MCQNLVLRPTFKMIFCTQQRGQDVYNEQSGKATGGLIGALTALPHDLQADESLHAKVVT